MVLVAAGHALGAVDKGGGPGRVVGERAHDAVRLDVALAHEQDSIGVAQLVPIRAVRVVAGAHGVDVHALHLADFLEHVRAGDGAPALEAVLVAVDAAHDQALAVEQDHAVADLHGLKADGAGLHVHGVAALSGQLNTAR